MSLNTREKITSPFKLTSEQASERASRRDNMKKYRVSLEVDKEWVKNFDLTFDAADEQDAEAQAMIEVKQNLKPVDVKDQLSSAVSAYKRKEGANFEDSKHQFEAPKEFVVPGEEEVAARLDVARTVCRRAERSAVGLGLKDSYVVPYLNRLSDFLWSAARWQEGQSVTTKSVPVSEK